MPYIEKRGNSYGVKYTDPETGRERSRTFGKQGDADRFMTTTKADQLRGVWVDPVLARTPFSEYSSEWRKTIRAEPGALLNIDGRLRNHVLPFFGSFTLEQIKPSHVRVWLTSMSRQRLAPATVKAAYWTLKSMLDVRGDRRLPTAHTMRRNHLAARYLTPADAFPRRAAGLSARRSYHIALPRADTHRGLLRSAIGPSWPRSRRDVSISSSVR
jgi:Phage integrase, N-terminal SAM-like domain